MAKTLKRVLSAVLVFCMFVGLLPQITVDFSTAQAAATTVYYDFTKANTGSYGATVADWRSYFQSLTYDKVASTNTSISSGEWAYHSYSCTSADSTDGSCYTGYYYESGIGFIMSTASRKNELQTAVKLKVANAGKYVPFINIHGGYLPDYAGVITANFRALNSDGTLGDTLATKKIHVAGAGSSKHYVAISNTALDLSATEYALELIIDNERVMVVIDGLYLVAATNTNTPVSFTVGAGEGYVEVNVGETVTMPMNITTVSGNEFPYESSSNYGYTTNNTYVTTGVDKVSKTVSFTGLKETSTPQMVEFSNGYATARVNVVVKPAGYKKPVETLYYDFKKVLPDYVTVNHVHNMAPLLTYAMSTTGAYGEINKWTGTASEKSIDSDPWAVASLEDTVIFSPLFHNYGIANKNYGITDVKIKVPVGGVYTPYLNIPTAYPMGTPLTISILNSAGTTLSTKTLAAGTSGTQTAISDTAIVLPKGDYIVRFNKTEKGSSVDAGANYYDGIELVPQTLVYDFEKANTGTYGADGAAKRADFASLTYDKVASLNTSVTSAPWAYYSYSFDCTEASPDSHVAGSFAGYGYADSGFAMVPTTRKQTLTTAVKIKADVTGKFVPFVNLNRTSFDAYAGVITANFYKLSNGTLGDRIATKQIHTAAYQGKDNYVAISDSAITINGGEYVLEFVINNERTIAIIDDFTLVPAEAKTPVSITIGDNEGLVEVNAGETVSVPATVMMSDGTKLNLADSTDWEYTTGNSYVTLGVDKSNGKFTFVGKTATSTPQTVYFKNGNAYAKINVTVNAAGTTKVAEDLYYDFTKVLPDTVTANGVYNMGKYLTYAMSTPGAFGEINKWTGTTSATSVDSDPWAVESLDSTIKFSPCFHNYGIKSVNKGIADIKIKVPAAGTYRPYLSIGTAYPTGSALTMSFLDSNGTELSTCDITTGTSGEIPLSNAPLELAAGEYIVRFNKTEVGSSLDSGANLYDGIHLYNIVDTGLTDIVYDFMKGWNGDTTADYVKTITYDMTTTGGANELNTNRPSAPWAFLSDDSTGGNSYFKYNYASYGLCKSLKGTATLKIKVPTTGYYIPSANLYYSTQGDATITIKRYDATTDTVGDQLAQLVTPVSATTTQDYSFGSKVFLAKGEYALEITAANVSRSGVIINSLTLVATDSAELGSIEVDLKANYYNDTIGFYPDDTSKNVDDIKVILISTTGEDISESAVLGENYSATYSSSDTSVATIDANGHIVAKKLGTTTITATVTLNGITKTASYTFEVVTGGKQRRSYYRDDKVEAMRQNATKYSFAKNSMNNAVKNSAKFLENPEKLWDSVTSQELPRSYYTTYRADPAYSKCHYCGVDLVDEYGSPYYSWKIDAWNTPWKIQCPDCLNYFPSNDFGSFYNLGIGSDGKWSYELAKSENAKLVAAGQTGYLVNTAYPEKGTGWGVDDGYGYVSDTTFTAPNGDTVNSTHTYMSFYNHWGIWHTSLLYNAVGNLRTAYLYTGDIRYGRVGAILIDRMADVYPDMTTSPYRYQFTDSANYAPQGKVSDYIWENQLAERWAASYDAFWPAYEDEEVISIISARAAKYNMANDKTTAAKIRQNCEDGILREIYKSVQVGKIGGNFGMYQSTLAIAAVALDSEPETVEMLDWIFRDGEQLMVDGAIQVNKITGGNVNRQLFDAVDTDGIPDEVAPNYNQLWVESLYELVDYLAGYDKYPECDLYNNPKYMKMNTVVPEMLIRRWAMPQIGDSGATAKDAITMLKDNNRYVHGFMYTKNPIFAQVLYMYNGFKSTGLHYPSDHPDPMSLADDVQAIIDRDGLFDYEKSRMLTDYGYAALRKPTVGDNLETQTTYWMLFARGAGHGHRDALHLSIDAKGLAVAPDLGYPTSTTGYEYASWGQTTTSHNTVVVNDGRQFRLRTTGIPHHFDDAGLVKVMDASAEHQYSIEDYRRTVVSVNVDEDDTYAVDFFHVNGGDEHLYSFHALADTVTTSGLTLTPQTDSSGNYVGTYSGASVPFATYETRQIGYTYLYNVDRDADVVGGSFVVDFQIEDYRGVRDTEQDTHLKMTMLNGFDLAEVALADGNPPKRDLNPEKLKFVLARRSGTDLNSLFTTVFEPYNDNSNISSISAVTVKRADGSSMTSDEKVRAVKVVLKNGRCDYITFANKTDVEYTVDNLFNVKGFVTVYSLKDGKNVYSYVNDGTKVGSLTTTASYTGKIKDFTKESAFENTLTVSFDNTVDTDNLIGRYLYVDRDTVDNGNATYEILDVTKSGDDYVLDIGDTTLIDKLDTNGDYVYMVNTGDTFKVPLSAVAAESEVTFAETSDQSVVAESNISFNVSATSSIDRSVTYSASNLPDGATLDASTGKFSWTPAVSQIGTHTINFSATDGYGSATKAVNVTVGAPNSTVTLSEGGSVTVTYGSAMPAITAPTKDGYIFEGYYDGEEGTGKKYYNADGTSAAEWDKTGSHTLYAKWVEGNDALGTKGVFMRNLKTTSGSSTKYHVYLFSGIDDHLKYDEVGFEVTVNGVTMKLATREACTAVAASNGTVTASDLGKKCNKIFAYKVNFPEYYKDMSLVYRAYAIDTEGNTIYGKYVTIDAIYNKD